MFNKWADRAEHGGIGHQQVNLPVNRAQTRYGGRELLEVPHVRAKPVGVAPRVFDFEFGDVEFALAAAKQSHPNSGFRKTNSKALADSTAGARDQRSQRLVQRGILPLVSPGLVRTPESGADPSRSSRLTLCDQIAQFLKERIRIVIRQRFVRAETRPRYRRAVRDSARRVGGAVAAIRPGAENEHVFQPGDIDRRGEREFLVAPAFTALRRAS